MSERNMDNNNSRKIVILNELTEILKAREPMDYSEINPALNPNVDAEYIASLDEKKEVEVKALQQAWEQLEELLFNDLQITLQEKNQLVTYLGQKLKEDKQKQKSRAKSRTQVWRSNE
ncbi:hypothetical protein CXK86_19880 [Paenibacillus sp. BGI2013]|uniref:Uncharacterized protein n=1 Tax=Paenibacillus amylolyticus TaxID=1451 RepID=A0ABD8B2C6_PAEAM|nr:MULTISPECIES: hypothetical protein [unclassified Paenibacillus]PJN64609.1 hypothetical protein PAEAM_06950 [Paenibacillus sp. GM1FR]PKQ89313.1 hypothetical protein CXK86_19880 [Paenibacillus sp. BGI2013]